MRAVRSVYDCICMYACARTTCIMCVYVYMFYIYIDFVILLLIHLCNPLTCICKFISVYRYMLVLKLF